MPLAHGTRFGPYEIVAMLGAGGMGEVYRAHDAKLRRDVAIKVLPAVVADDAERLMRFEREAQVLASLNHPNIAAIYGFEQRAIVMELVEGDTLSERIAQGPLRWPEALPIARQIADALEAAHEKGIVHRDLKPANIKLTPEGVVKVLDFGLAKAMDPATQSGSVANSPTLTARATQMGMILGTAAYMSPEQARGRSVDRRADIWAFGCVLFELVAGRRVFEGDEITDVLARLIEREPDWSALPAGTSRDLRRLLERCLTKDPKTRLRDIGEARIAIDDALAGRSSAPAATDGGPSAVARPAWRRLLPWALSAALAAVSMALLIGGRAPSGVRPMARVDLVLPGDVEFFNGPSLSADGMKLAFVGVRQGVRQVYVRALDQDETKPIAGTDAASASAISPGGTQVAFSTTDLRLQRVTLANGIVEPLGTGVAILSRPAWIGDDAIVWSQGTRLLVRVLAEREERELAATVTPDEISLSWPVATDDGRFVLFTSRRRTAQGMRYRLEAVPSAGGARRVVLDDGEQLLAASGGRIVFKQGGALFAAPFDMGSAKTTGPPVRLGEAFTMSSTGAIAADVSQSGEFVAAPSSMDNARLVWVSMTGVERPLPGDVRGYQNPRVSPTGRLIAFSETGAIWTLDPERGTFARVSGDPEPNVGFPVWSPDGARLYYRSTEGIRVQRADGAGQPSVLKNTDLSDYPGSLTPDGRTLVLLRIGPETGGDLFTTPAEGGDLAPILSSNAYEGGPQVSPDGKWLLYVSNETGRMEIYLRPFGGGDRKWPVSGDGGLHPLWSRDGRRIFYRSAQRMMAVDFSAVPDVRLGAPVMLFDHRYAFGPNLTVPNYSLSADGREFLMVRDDANGRHLTLILNWLQNLGR